MSAPVRGRTKMEDAHARHEAKNSDGSLDLDRLNKVASSYAIKNDYRHSTANVDRNQAAQERATV
jgi:hypothetical protein